MGKASLYHGDCLEIMPTLDCKVDLVLADPPYGTTQCKWDSIIPIQIMFDVAWKLNSKIIAIFGNEPFCSIVRYEHLKNYKYDWIWKKNNAANFTQAKRMPLNFTERIMVFSSNNLNKTPYNPQNISDKRIKKYTGKIPWEGQTNKKRQKFFMQDKTGYPSSILEFPIVPSKSRQHPTQKPIALLEYLIKTYTNEGDTVLDFCMGSGSTGVAALNLNRNFIGIEKDKKYFQIAKKRIEETK